MLLVLSRREGERVVIGDPARPIGTVEVATIKGDKVRLAFEFPGTVQVNREEIARQIVIDIENGEKR